MSRERLRVVVKPSEWLEEFLDEARSRLEEGSDVACPEPRDFDPLAPVQVRDYWVEPLDLHKVVVTHFDEGPRREVEVVGPLALSGLAQELEEDLEDDRWDAEFEPRGFDLGSDPRMNVPSPPETFREVHRRELASFFSKVKGSVFAPDEVRRTARFQDKVRGDQVLYLTLYGPLSDIDPAEVAERHLGSMIESTAPSQADEPHEPRTGGNAQTGPESTPTTSSKPSSGPDLEERDGVWTYLYPPVQIGDTPTRSVAEIASGHDPDPFRRPPDEFQKLREDFLVSYDGFLGVEVEDIQQASRLLNLVAFSLGTLGTKCHYIFPRDRSGYERHPDSDVRLFKSFGYANSPRGPAVRNASNDVWGSFSSLRRPVELQEIGKAIDRALEIRDGPGARDVLLLFQAETLTKQAAYSAGLLLAWTVIEREINRRFRESVLNQDPWEGLGIDQMRSSLKLEAVQEIGENSFDREPEISDLRGSRNEVVHGETLATSADAETACEVAWELLRPRVLGDGSVTPSYSGPPEPL